MRRKSNRKKVRRDLVRAFQDTMRQLDSEFQDVMTVDRYWAGFEGSETKRQNGEVVSGAFRNIVDLNNAAGSQKLELSDSRAVFTWDGNGVTPVYSIFFGHRTETGFVPGRDWITPAISDSNVEYTMTRNF